MKRIILAVTLLAFVGLTILAVVEFGFVGIFSHQLQNVAGMQVLFDLFIALSLFSVWMWNDAKKFHRPFWPWLFLILSTGSIGALLYLLLYKTGSSKVQPAD
jgi:hypothetical protein